MKKHALEVIASIWLVLIAVQYAGSYFINGLNVDFMWAYFGMICVTAVVVAMDVLRAVQSREDTKK